jgi:hypothetical protein
MTLQEQLDEAEKYIGDLQDEVAVLEQENRDLQRALNAAPTDEDLQ